MSNWKEITEEGVVYYVNDELGNVMKVGDMFVSMMPVVVKLGPFKTLEEAKASLMNKQAVKNLIEEYNAKLLR